MKKTRKINIYNVLSALLLMVCVILIFIGFKASSAEAKDYTEDKISKTYEVTCPYLFVRTGPSTNYSKLGGITLGTKITGSMTDNNWVEFTYNGKTGYSCGDYLKEASKDAKVETPLAKETKNTEVIMEHPVKDETVSTKYKVTTGLNVRTGPGTTYPKVGLLSTNTVINPISKTSNNWYKITYNGKEAYVSGDYVKEYVPITNAEGMTDDPSDYIIVINSKTCKLNVYYQNKLWREYDCATGTDKEPTPEGHFTVANKIVNPSYHNIAGGASNNPLGKRWMGILVPGTNGGHYGIHGNINEASIGTHASQGCVRMHNDEVEELYPYIPIGSTILIKYTDDDDIAIASEYGFTIEK